MTVCVVHQDHEADEGWLVCRRAWGRLGGSLRQIPTLVGELHGLGYVQRDTGRRRSDDGQVVNGWDPVAHALPAGPLNGSRNGAKVSGSPGRSAPIRIDPTDLLGRPRHGSLSVADRSRWPGDQVGYLSAATVLDFWVRDWADLRGESLPVIGAANSSVTSRGLADWLLDRLDWACQHFMALDEFAGDIQTLSSRLYGLAGYGASRPKLMEAPCPSCHLLTLTQCYEESNIDCENVDCRRSLTPDEYAGHVRTLIEENS